MPPVPVMTQPDAPPAALVAAWVDFIRALEAHYDAPVRQTPAEVLAAATWAARLGQHPPALPAVADSRPLVAAR